jgi:high-affinity nickel-transport protein
MSVAAMLVVLGVMNVTGAMRAIGERVHGEHAHPHSTEGALLGSSVATSTGSALLVRPVVVGVVHGLAGSAAIALLVLATVRDPVWALVYLAVFGLGTILGMVMLTAAMAVPLAAAAARSRRFERTLVHVTGLVSISFGLFLAYRIGVHDGLFVGTPLSAPR